MIGLFFQNYGANISTTLSIIGATFGIISVAIALSSAIHGKVPLVEIAKTISKLFSYTLGMLIILYFIFRISAYNYIDISDGNWRAQIETHGHDKATIYSKYKSIAFVIMKIELCSALWDYNNQRKYVDNGINGAFDRKIIRPITPKPAYLHQYLGYVYEYGVLVNNETHICGRFFIKNGNTNSQIVISKFLRNQIEMRELAFSESAGAFVVSYIENMPDIWSTELNRKLRDNINKFSKEMDDIIIKLNMQDDDTYPQEILFDIPSYKFPYYDNIGFYSRLIGASKGGEFEFDRDYIDNNIDTIYDKLKSNLQSRLD